MDITIIMNAMKALRWLERNGDKTDLDISENNLVKPG